MLYESKEPRESLKESDEGRKTHFQVDNRDSENLLNKEGRKLFMTMRAYNVKRGRRGSNSCQSNNSSSRAYNEEQDYASSVAIEEKQSKAGTNANNSIHNSEKIPTTMNDSVGVSGSKCTLE